jgi:hypothetical protein
MKSEIDYLEYLNKLSPDEQKWIKQFYNEYYRAPVMTDESIIKDPDMKKEANRVHNTMYRDIFSIAEKTGALGELSPDEDRFMQEASDEWEWNTIYKTQGYESAIKQIFYQCERDLENKLIPVQVTLARFLNKYLALKKLNNRRRDNE